MAHMPTLDTLMLRGWWLMVVASCSAPASGPAASGVVATGPQPAGATNAKPVAVAVAAVPAASCARAIQNVNMLWTAASIHASPTEQAIYANAGTKLTPALIALCQNDQWSPAGRNCVAQAASLAAIDLCTHDFSASQQAHLQTTTAEIIDTVDLTIVPAVQPGLPQP